jgi:phage FluMu protein Com
MCFRPGGVAKAQICPNCGKKLIPLGGVIQKKCPFCKTDFTAMIEAAKAEFAKEEAAKKAEAAKPEEGARPAEEDKKPE